MVLYRTGNVAFDNAVAACEATRQNALQTAQVQADWDAADKIYYACVINAGAANGVNTPNERLAFNLLTRGIP
jgi:hypothetical protein